MSLGRNSYFPMVLLTLLLLTLGGVGGYFLTSNREGIKLPELAQPEAHLSMPLAASAEQGPLISVLPSWFIALLALFTAVQIVPLFIAASRARRLELTQRDYRTISFLCDTPVFLGLLGSLIGVAITQFVSGSLAAPLAYMTTISGIVLHLFAKFTIWLPLYDKLPRPGAKKRVTQT